MPKFTRFAAKHLRSPLISIQREQAATSAAPLYLIPPVIMPEHTRRSGRSRKVNTRYAGDAWGKETLRLLRESSESSNPTSIDSDQEILGDDNDEEFDEKAAQVATTEAVAEDDNLSIQSGSSKSSQVRTPVNEEVVEDEDDEVVSDDGGDKGERVVKRSKFKRPADVHSRGITVVERGRSNKHGAWQAMFGPYVEDVMPMLDIKDLWVYTARDATLPSRITLGLARKQDWLRKHKPESEDAGTSASGILQDYSDRQKLLQISLQEARKRLFYVEGADHEIVLGPWSKQQKYNLPYMKPISLGQAWQRSTQEPESSYHSGWLMNVGEKPQHMAWSPYDGSEQHLALVCRSTPQQRASAGAPDADTAPAFTPSPAYPMCIQIWKFATSNNETGTTLMDFGEMPRLSQILACSFGDVKQLAWLSKSSDVLNAHAEERLGTLVILTTDGCVRFIHVPKKEGSAAEPVCFEVVSPVIIVEPPTQSLFTCFTFASSSDIILGTASGSVHIYNVSDLPSSQDKLEPYYSVQIHHTYLLSLCALEDEAHSHFIASSSASGAIQLIDLRAPDQDKLTLARARLPTRNLIFNRHCRTYITTVDSSGNTEPRGNAQTTLMAHNFRHFYATTTLSKYPEGSGTATTLIGSPLHPFLLMGNTSGSVWSQNIVRRMLPTGRGLSSDAGAWVQKVIEYEWIPKQRATASDERKDKADFYNGPPVRPGVSRMHHGFKPERLDLSHVGSRKRKAPASGPSGESAIQTIFEEEQAVTVTAWNNNSSVASWCSIGWGSGVVLVTDLGHDAR